MKKIYPELISRRDIITEAVERALDMMYKLSYPRTSLAELRGHIKSLSDEERKKYSCWQSHYLPKKLQDEILEMFVSAYNIKSELHDNIDLFISYAFNDPIVEVYKTDEYGMHHREYDRAEKLGEVIDNEASEKVKEYAEMCKKFYNRDMDHETFQFNMFDMAPCMYKETTEKWYRQHGDPDFKIDESIFPDSIYGDDEDKE